MANSTSDQVQSTGINWEKTALRDAHGGLDVEATLQMIEAELVAQRDREVPTEEIAAAVASVFSVSPEKNLSVSTLVLRTMMALQADDARVSKRVNDYITGESKLFESSKGEKGALWTKRGAGGGVFPRTEELVKNYQAALAKKAAAA